MINQPIVSVIIPIYKVEKFLRECIDSVISQTYKNLQIILVDDGSPDKCGDICDDYASKDSRVSVIHKENGGLSDARNAGIEIATGDYITFVDSDDSLDCDAIEYMYQNLVRENADLSVCQKYLVDEEGLRITDRFIYKDVTFNDKYSCMKGYLSTPLIGSVAWAKLYKREIFNVLRFPKGKYNEDEFTTYLAIDLANVVVVGKERKYAYRQRESSIMNSTFSLKHLDCIEAAKIRTEFVEKKYPKLKKYARALVVHATNMTVRRIIDSKNIQVDAEKMLKEFQRTYRKYGCALVFSKYSIKSKIFTILASISLKLLVKTLKKR